MTNKKPTTIVNFILDKSGSMSSIQDATISGFNEYLQTLRKDKKSNYEFTLTLFDTDVTLQVEGENVKDVRDLDRGSYKPDGMTALYDAVCQTISKTKPKKGQKALVIIMTDGQENSSKEYTHLNMRDMIKEREKSGNWTFVYLGANQDSYAVASSFGISTGNTANFHATSAGAGATMRAMATATTAYACSMSPQSAEVLTTAKADIENTK